MATGATAASVADHVVTATANGADKVASSIIGGIDKLYSDIATNGVPMLGKAFVVSKEYFTDLFGRAISYIIFTDVVDIIYYIVLTIIFAVVFKKANAKRKEIIAQDRWDYSELNTMIVTFMFALCAVAVIGSMININHIFSLLQHIVQTIYIPEKSIYDFIGTLKQ